ncbi:MAG TPA: type II toxin-antitoxin system VapC family toxin [Acidimicrobiia bacterium]|nr:type II toxin-antitoxin system VapC family toxin [Acidimicrobiia bacterium]
MIVLDSSAAVALISETGPGAESLTNRVEAERERAAPHLVDPEASRALRRLARAGEAEITEIPRLLAEFLDLRIQRYPHVALLPRVWELRDTVGAYDAFYVALAEALACPLVTTDARLARAHGHEAEIELFA